jgi:hypothetical protein
MVKHNPASEKPKTTEEKFNDCKENMSFPVLTMFRIKINCSLKIQSIVDFFLLFLTKA